MRGSSSGSGPRRRAATAEKKGFIVVLKPAGKFFVGAEINNFSNKQFSSPVREKRCRR